MLEINAHILWIYYILASISITHIIVGGSIFGPIRKIIINSNNYYLIKLKISDLVMCYSCSGFWVGVFTAPIWMTLFEKELFSIKSIIFILSFGTVISLLSDLFYRIKQYLCDQCG